MAAVIPQINEGTTLLEFYRQLMQGSKPVDGKILDCTFLVADGVVKLFAHGLGRPWIGAFVCGNSKTNLTSAQVGLSFGAGSDPEKVGIRLTVAADCTIRLWVW